MNPRALSPEQTLELLILCAESDLEPAIRHLEPDGLGDLTAYVGWSTPWRSVLVEHNRRMTLVHRRDVHEPVTHTNVAGPQDAPAKIRSAVMWIREDLPR